MPTAPGTVYESGTLRPTCERAAGEDADYLGRRRDLNVQLAVNYIIIERRLLQGIADQLQKYFMYIDWKSLLHNISLCYIIISSYTIIKGDDYETFKLIINK